MSVVASGQTSRRQITERLDHLGMVAGVCYAIGLAEWLMPTRFDQGTIRQSHGASGCRAAEHRRR